LPVTDEEKVICYADKFYSKTRPDETNTLQRIRTDLKKYGESGVIQFNSWNLLFEGEKSA